MKMIFENFILEPRSIHPNLSIILSWIFGQFFFFFFLPNKSYYLYNIITIYTYIYKLFLLKHILNIRISY